LWSLLLWRYSRPAWTRSSAACCRWPCFGRGIGLHDPQRSLPTPTILWFCDSYFSENWPRFSLCLLPGSCPYQVSSSLHLLLPFCLLHSHSNVWRTNCPL